MYNWLDCTVWAKFCLFVLFRAIYECSYKISMYKAREPREANEACVKDYLNYKTQQKNKNADIGTQNDQNLG